MKNLSKITLMAVTFTVVAILISFNVNSTDAKIDLDSLADEYEVIFNHNLEKFEEKEQLKKLLHDEKKKDKHDEKEIEKLEKKIEKIEKHLDEKDKYLDQIEAIVKNELKMDPQLRKQLNDAEKILKNTDYSILPWSGLGVSPSEKAVTISIADDDPESYRELIEELVGSDVPVIIYQGEANPFKVCDTRYVDCTTLQGGLAISNQDNDEYTCTLTISVMRDGVEGFLTAGHCFELGDVIYQPNSIDGGPIGVVTARVFNGTCDCAFIEMNSEHIWDEDIVYNTPSLPQFDELYNRYDPVIDGTILHISGATSNYVDIGFTDGSYTCQGGNIFTGIITVYDLYRTRSTNVVNGDSGAPVLDGYGYPDDKAFYGIVSCSEQAPLPLGASYDDDAIFVQWSKIVKDLDLD